MSRTHAVLSCCFALALCAPTYALGERYDGDPSWDHPYDHPDHECADFGPSDSPGVQQKLAEKFGVDERHIARLRDEHLGYGEIDHTLTLAERMPGGINRENVHEILFMREEQGMGWGQIAKAEGTTLGRAKREFPTQPPVDPEPKPAATAEPASSAQLASRQTPTAQPKSLSRQGKSSYTAAKHGSSANAHGGKGERSASRGASKHSAPAATATSSPARSGGHAYGRGSSGGGSVGKANGKSNGKAKGLE